MWLDIFSEPDLWNELFQRTDSRLWLGIPITVHTGWLLHHITAVGFALQPCCLCICILLCRNNCIIYEQRDTCVVCVFTTLPYIFFNMLYLSRFYQRMRENIFCFPETRAARTSVKHHERNKLAPQKITYHSFCTNGSKLVSYTTFYCIYKRIYQD